MNSESTLLLTGLILFIFSLGMIALLIIKNKPYLKAIWFLLIAFLMMGFSVISQAEIVGLFKYKKGKELTILEIYAEALKYCPDNENLKENLNEKVVEFEKTKKAEKIVAKEILSDVYLTLENEEKATKYADEVLQEDSNNSKAKEVKTIVETRKIINQLPKSINKKELIKNYKSNIQYLKQNQSVNKERIILLENKYAYSIDSIQKVHLID